MAGRPKKETTIEDVVENIVDLEKEELKAKNDEMAEMLKNLQAQMKLMQNQMVSNIPTQIKTTSKKIKVVNLLNNKLNLSTEGYGNGKLFQFEDFGSVVSISVAHLEDILSIGAFRKQAEDGLFYICDNDFVEEMDLADAYANIHDKKAIEYIVSLKDDACVDMFCGLSQELKDSIATMIAEKIANNIDVDRNKIKSIQMKTEIDIEKIADGIKEINNRKSA